MAAQLTPAQRSQLLHLHEAAATDRESAKGPYDRELASCNPMVLGKLRDAGLVDSRTVRRGRATSQFTAYWLTPPGVVRAREEASS